jgi:hypothetical protein
VVRRVIYIFVIFAIFATGTASLARAADTYKVAGGAVAVVCPLTVGGSFEAKTKNLSGDLAPASGQPGAVGGSLRVDLQTLETGIRMRDYHLKTAAQADRRHGRRAAERRPHPRAGAVFPEGVRLRDRGADVPRRRCPR